MRSTTAADHGAWTDAPTIPGVEPLTAGLEREWDELARASDASPFLRPAYLRLWRASFDADGRPPDVVVARREGRLAGALPVSRDGGRVGPPGNFETPAGGIVAGDPVAAAVVARGLLEWGARRVDFHHIPAAGASRQAIERAAVIGGHRVVRRVTMRSPVADTVGGWEAYWGARSRNLRHNVERCRRRAREAGELTFDVHHAFAPGELARLLEEGFAVEGSGWKTAQGTAILTSPRTRRYYTDLAGWAADEGWLRLSFLRIDGRPIAFCLGVEAFGVHDALKMGYDVAVARLSPGMMLLDALIRRAFETGLTRFDFAGHDEQYKLAWATGTEDQVSLSVFPPTPGGRLAYRTERTRIALAESPLRPFLRPAAVALRGAAARVRPRRGPHEDSAAGRETP
ncbi:GNAT family N-acetyltransferase [Miltoncostaea oceani]|uniref:GNAT family N-acetyltransferase n=1 Tax=Miltoncostaea oceani TaxID=2843216 RepID=UPI001C3DC97C|nr:GNAT family N-acetyltransferase [Miltoncostaea oceani]